MLLQQRWSKEESGHHLSEHMARFDAFESYAANLRRLLAEGCRRLQHHKHKLVKQACEELQSLADIELQFELCEVGKVLTYLHRPNANYHRDPV